MDEIQREFFHFMTAMEAKLAALNLTFDSLPLDHACFRASNRDEYDKFREIFKSNSILYTTKFFHERNFYMFVLKKPLEFHDCKVHYLEFAEPGGSDVYETGFQHIEFHTNIELNLLVQNPDILKELLFEGKHGDEVYLKWPDKSSVKVTKVPLVTKSIIDPEATITLTGVI